jgi:hypothetical protein
MKTINKLIALTIIIFSLTLTSCSSDDDTPPQNTHDDAYGDVLVKRMEMMGNVSYKLIFFAGGVDVVAAESKVTLPYNVTLADGTETNEFALEEFWAGSGSLRNMAAPMMMMKPAAGEFTFTLTFSDGYVKTITDTLEDTMVTNNPGVTIDYVPGDTYMIVTWNEVPNADFYCVKITDLDILAAKPLFKNGMIETTNTSLTINFDGGNGWMRPMEDLVSGTNYWVSVAAKKVESGAEFSGASKDFQLSACSKVQITY